MLEWATFAQHLSVGQQAPTRRTIKHLLEPPFLGGHSRKAYAIGFHKHKKLSDPRLRDPSVLQELLDTAGDSWMAPFADHLGIAPAEFGALRPLFAAGKSKVLLVEGTIDQQYFFYLQKHALACEKLAAEIEVVPYGGKDTLKNTLLVQFVLRTFDQLFVTFDLDAESDVRAALNRNNLKEGTDYAALGISQPGKDCIEGLLPQRVLSAVNGRETDLVMKLRSKDNSERRKAKDALKQRYLDEFQRHTDYTKDDLKELSKVVKQINSRYV